MEIEDLAGRCTVRQVTDLERRLKTVRKGDDGAFVLWHDRKGPSLWIHVNKNLAYMHYFPDGDGHHPGYLPTGKPRAGAKEGVRFLLVGGDEGSAIRPAPECLVSVDTAYCTAAEFLRSPALPPSISWLEL
jgi:hypothetical protein